MIIKHTKCILYTNICAFIIFVVHLPHENILTTNISQSTVYTHILFISSMFTWHHFFPWWRWQVLNFWFKSHNAVPPVNPLIDKKLKLVSLIQQNTSSSPKDHSVIKQFNLLFHTCILRHTRAKHTFLYSTIANLELLLNVLQLLLCSAFCLLCQSECFL